MASGGFARPADQAACREMIRSGSRSFHTASLLLPQDVREGAYALYGFCRLSDDAIDVDGGDSAAVGKLAARLDAVYAGRPAAHPVDLALADTVARFGIPRAVFDALLEGLEWDAAGRPYETLEEVFDYGARVAGSVGAMMAALMGARSPAMVARACDLGVAMQLTNIARDVGEDARAGRLYLPRAWLREAGVEPEALLADPVFSPALGSVVARLLATADSLYRRADSGVAALDPAFRPAILAARRLYAEIGELLARRGLDSISRRTSVSAGRKLWLLAGVIASAPRSSEADLQAEPLAANRFLVEAVARSTPARAAARRPGRQGLREDLIWTVELFSTLEDRRRPARLPR